MTWGRVFSWLCGLFKWKLFNQWCHIIIISAGEWAHRDAGLLFILFRFRSSVSADARSRDQLRGLRRLSQVLQVIVVIIKKHSEITLFLFPLLHLHLQEQMPKSGTRSGGDIWVLTLLKQWGVCVFYPGSGQKDMLRSCLICSQRIFLTSVHQVKGQCALLIDEGFLLFVRLGTNRSRL